MANKRRSVSDAEILRTIALLPDPVCTAPELAERLDMSRQGVNKRLKKLREKHLVGHKEVGAHAAVWWLTSEGRDDLALYEFGDIKSI
jgi:predicted ArsR family transcriptional regulator